MCMEKNRQTVRNDCYSKCNLKKEKNEQREAVVERTEKNSEYWNVLKKQYR